MREYEVPRELLYKAWTEPAYLWWFFNPDITPPDEPVIIGVRPGGVWRQRVMLDYETDYNTGGVYKEVDAPARPVVLPFGSLPLLLRVTRADGAAVVGCLAGGG